MAGIKRRGAYRQIADRAAMLGIAGSWEQNNINNWINQGVTHRDLAIDCICILRDLASENHSPLFNDDYLTEHAEVFLQSKACRNGPYMELTSEELRRVMYIGMDDRDRDRKWTQQIDLLKEYVLPTPPSESGLFGRDADITHMSQLLTQDDIFILFIDAPGGEGKTTVAWEVVRRLLKQDVFYDAVWITDKRHHVSIDGVMEIDHNNEVESLSLSHILHRIVRKFRWDDLYTITDVNRLIAECRNKLLTKPYLIVVDNLETMQGASQILSRLHSMMDSGNPLRQKSRIIITSRVWPSSNVPMHYVAHERITGLEPPYRHPYIEHLIKAENKDNNSHPIRTDDPMLDEIARQTAGNPLLIQLATKRYAYDRIHPNRSETLLSLLLGNQDEIFNHLFGDIVNTLHDEAKCFARYTAFESYNQEQGIIAKSTMWYVWQMLRGVEEPTESPHPIESYNTFSAVLRRLLAHGILNTAPPNVDDYTMHPLIRTFLMGDRLKEACLGEQESTKP